MGPFKSTKVFEYSLQVVVQFSSYEIICSAVEGPFENICRTW
jgi:hypothetical protein